MVHFSRLGSGSRSDIVGYDVHQLDGSPLPDWFDRAQSDLLMGRVPAGTDVIELTIKARLSDNRVLIQKVRILTATGEIKQIVEKRTDVDVPDDESAMKSGVWGSGAIKKLASALDYAGGLRR
jgi:hypothetical protein